MIEVELKFPVTNIDDVREKIIQLGGQPDHQSQQEDEYFNHPLHDHVEKDIALRIRCDSGQSFLTFKGPNTDKAALAARNSNDSTKGENRATGVIGKIRHEIEFPLSEEQVAQMREVFLGLGYFSVAKVCKTRDVLTLKWEEQSVEVCLDQVQDVGQFVEIELVTDEANQEQAKQTLSNLAAQLGLTGAISTSYLGMLLRNE